MTNEERIELFAQYALQNINQISPSALGEICILYRLSGNSTLLTVIEQSNVTDEIEKMVYDALIWTRSNIFQGIYENVFLAQTRKELRWISALIQERKGDPLNLPIFMGHSLTGYRLTHSIFQSSDYGRVILNEPGVAGNIITALASETDRDLQGEYLISLICLGQEITKPLGFDDWYENETWDSWESYHPKIVAAILYAME